jgi:hypothetical protein
MNFGRLTEQQGLELLLFNRKLYAERPLQA